MRNWTRMSRIGVKLAIFALVSAGTMPISYQVKAAGTTVTLSPDQSRIKLGDTLNVNVSVSSPDFSVVQSVYYSWDDIQVATDLSDDVKDDGNATLETHEGPVVGFTDPHSLDVEVMTEGGIFTASGTYIFDGIAPAFVFKSDPIDAYPQKQHDVLLVLADNDPGDTYQISQFWDTENLDWLADPDSITWPASEALVTGNNVYSKTGTDIEGDYYFYAKVIDSAGNETIERAGPYTVDTKVPELTSINGKAPICSALTMPSDTPAECTDSGDGYDPAYAIDWNLIVDGKGISELDGYEIRYKLLSPDDVVEGKEPPYFYYGDTVWPQMYLSEGSGLTFPDDAEHYIQFMVTDPAGNYQYFLSDKFTVGPSYAPQLSILPTESYGDGNEGYISGDDPTLGVTVAYKNPGRTVDNLEFSYALITADDDDYTGFVSSGLISGFTPGDDGVYRANTTLDLTDALNLRVWTWQEDVEYQLVILNYTDPVTGVDAWRTEQPYFYYDATAPVIDSIVYDPPSGSAAETTVTASVYYSDGQMLPNGQQSEVVTYTFTANGSRDITLKDAVGNTLTRTLTVDWITANYSVTYDSAPGTWTKEAVNATIDFDPGNSVIFDDEQVQDEGNGTYTYTITNNGDYTLGYSYGPGLTGSVLLSVDWIDTMPPTGSVTYSLDLDNRSMIASLTASDNSGEAPVLTDANGNEIAGDWTHVFTDNGTYTFYFKDSVGNIGSAVAAVSNFDKTPPELSVIYSTTQLTNTFVRATVKANEPITVLGNGGSISYDFEENGSFTFEVADRFGNKSSITATVENIDKEAPVASLTYSTTVTTKNDVVATVSIADEDGVFSVLNNYGRRSYLFKENGTFTFILADAAGNRTEVIATVTNIDKSKVSYTLTYSETELTKNNVTVTVVPEAGKTLHYPGNDGSPSVTFEENGMRWLLATDDLGNEYGIQLMVQWIDTEAPKISIDKDYIIAQHGTIPDLEAGVRVTDNFGDYTLTYTEDINPAIPGNYMVTYTATDTLGNVATASRAVEVIKAEELKVYVNGELINVGNIVNMNSDLLDINIFGTRGEWELQGVYGQLTASRFKSGRYMLDPDQDIEVKQQGYYTIFVRDQELQQQVIQIYVIPQDEQGE